jgi:ribosomal protein S18 acetylase RimI-like enzyme
MNDGRTAIIRPATPDDRSALERCFDELQEFERRIEPNRVEGSTIAAAYIDGLLDACTTSDGRISVAECDGTVVGFVCVLAGVDSGEIIERWRERAYVTDVIVLSDERGRGIGRMLMEAAETYAIERGSQTLLIGVLAGNKPARRLYKALGFRDHELTLKKAIGGVSQ